MESEIFNNDSQDIESEYSFQDIESEYYENSDYFSEIDENSSSYSNNDEIFNEEIVNIVNNIFNDTSLTPEWWNEEENEVMSDHEDGDIMYYNYLSVIKKAKKDNIVDEPATKYECVICMTNERKLLYSKCKHLCCCMRCFEKIKNPKKCPICRCDDQWPTHKFDIENVIIP